MDFRVGLKDELLIFRVYWIKIKALKTLVWHLLREPMKAFVEGANERSEFLEEKKTVIYNEEVRTNKAKD